MNMTVVIRDVNFNKRALNLIRALPDEIERAITEEAKIILQEAKDLCPWDTGALKASGQILSTEHPAGHETLVPISFGEGLTYAIYVHENLDPSINHPNGGQAKFLETAINKNAAGFTGRLATRIKLERLVE